MIKCHVLGFSGMAFAMDSWFSHRTHNSGRNQDITGGAYEYNR